MSTPDFKTICEQSLDALTKFEQLLEQEHLALQSRDLDQFQEILKSKHQMLENINQHNKAREQVLATAGLSNDKAGVQQFIASHPEPDQLKSIWSQLESSLNNIAEANKRNEQTLMRSQRNLTHLLSILQGQSKRNQLYTANGGKGNYAAQSRIGKA